MKKFVSFIVSILIIVIFLSACNSNTKTSKLTSTVLVSGQTITYSQYEEGVPITGAQNDAKRPRITAKYTSYSYSYTKPLTITLKTSATTSSTTITDITSDTNTTTSETKPKTTSKTKK